MNRTSKCGNHLCRSILLVMLAVVSSCGEETTQQKATNAPAAPAVPATSALAYNTAADVPKCDDSRESHLAYIVETGSFQLCRQGNWEAIDLRGPPGESATSINAKLRDVWRQTITSTAILEATYGGGACTTSRRLVGRGTGFVTARNQLATNAHVVSRRIPLTQAEADFYGCPTRWAPLEKVDVWFPADTSGDTRYLTRSADARVTRVDDTIGESDDLALLEVNTGDRRIVPISEHDQSPNKVDGPGVRLGDEVLLIGYSRATTFAHFVPGQVNAIQPVTDEFLGEFLAEGRIVYQVDVVAGRGSSGGPLLDIDGKVIGVNFLGDSPESDTQFSYAYRVKVLRDFLKQTRSWYVVPNPP